MTRHLQLAALVLAAAVAASSPLSGQKVPAAGPKPTPTPAPAAAAPGGGTSAAPGQAASGQPATTNEQTIDQILAGEEAVLSGEGYTYDPAGRRDPFVSLLQRTQAKALPAQRPEGVPGLLIDEIDIKGVFQLNGRMFAQVQTSDKEKSYLIQEGDQLYDGSVVSIANNEVTFKQVVNDPSVVKPFREVVKKLNPAP